MNTNYASFGKRLVAYLVDSLILNVLGMILGYGLTSAITSGGLDPATGMGITTVLFLLLYFGYFGYFESSEKQATPGKSVMKLKVTDLNGARISFGKAVVRNLMKFISALILLIGYFMAAFTEKKQALHDMAAGTLILDYATAKNLNTTV